MLTTCPVVVPDRMTASEAVGPGSIPGRATGFRPASVMDGTAIFGTARRSFNSSAGCLKMMSSECAGLHAKSAEVVDQVQFLARTLLPRRWSQTARQPAASAVQLGSTPTGFSDHSNFRSSARHGQAAADTSAAIVWLNRWRGPRASPCRIAAKSYAHVATPVPTCDTDATSARQRDASERRDAVPRWRSVGIVRTCRMGGQGRRDDSN